MALRKIILIPKVIVGVCAYDTALLGFLCLIGDKHHRLANIQSLRSSKFTLLQLQIISLLSFLAESGQNMWGINV